MGNLKVTLNPKEKKDKKLKRNKTTGKTTQKKFRNGNSSWNFFEKMMGNFTYLLFFESRFGIQEEEKSRNKQNKKKKTQVMFSLKILMK